jgi:hypothetical protein
MADIGDRIRRAMEEMTGNEALLEMLETNAAEEMLDWGKSLAASLVRRTEELDDFIATQTAESNCVRNCSLISAQSLEKKRSSPLPIVWMQC